ncbi:ATP-binding protein [Flaviaesturariibacter aridisoli]|uniref:histidine kinase n=1 Tax=Flaviaesturariibacter aridisoli TaxID=2545761 RepID=A0A4R4DWY9_9BACT|nr:ATP-binding protein [Flaviaesturariibacter aridisoli]TCZ67327.1 GAF domain-containing protein [Flaviaesturariibacter aridisoli]
MNITDIVNRNVATLATCESEPIHIPGTIQPHGVLAALNAGGIFRYCSANCARYFGKEAGALLQQPLASADEELAQALQPALNGAGNLAKPLRFFRNDTHWDVFGCFNEDGLFVIECEVAVPDAASDDLYDQTSRFVQHIDRARTLQDLCQRIAEQTRVLTGYDRVMIYRFDKDYNGQVYAESREAHLEPYLDLHYPHTDIPVQARDLYLRNLMRMIPDVRYEPVPLLTVAAGSPAPLDLSDARLRSVSPLHIQYLKNMGVAATLTISLLLEGRLWGLVTCHHYSPRHLGHLQRKAALLQAHFLSSQIQVREVAEEYAVHTVVDAHLQHLLHAMETGGDFSARFRRLNSLLPVANASGAAILHEGRIYTMGRTPAPERLRALFQWLAGKPGMEFVTAHLEEHYPDAARIAGEASGILYHKLGDPKREAILWLREEQERTINWAGNPHEAVKRSPATNALTPRSSFAIFRELVQGRSLDWRRSEVAAASRFATTLQNNFHLEHLQAEEASQRVLNEKLMKANQELANINWITTHDLKEPLRKILVFASRIAGEEDAQLSANLLHSLNRIQQSARRMQTLVEDLMAYRLLDVNESPFVPVDLNAVLRDIVDEYEEELREKGGVLVWEGLPVLPMIPYQARQLFGNLVSNALKFQRPGVAPHITVQCTDAAAGSFHHPTQSRTGDFYHIRVQDNGIGFDPDQNARIFDIFYRLHNAEAYRGTGIGLAICKRIVENHGGFITASGDEARGASFSIFLPKDRGEG